MIQTDDLDKPLAERCDQFLHLVEVRYSYSNDLLSLDCLQRKKGEQKLTNIDAIKDLLAEAERLEIMEQAAFLVAQCVFTDNILKEIDEYKTLLTKVSR